MPSQTFNPEDVLDLRNAVGTGIVGAIFRAANDFFFGNGKPWYYYAGVAVGGTAAATGIEGATATTYVVANVVEAYVLKGPGNGEMKVFLDGVEQGVIDLEAATEIWELVELVIDPAGAVLRRVDLQSVAVAGAAWMAIGPIILTHDTDAPTAQERTQAMAYDTIVFKVRDAESDTNESSVPINVPTGFTLAQLQTYVDAIAPQIDVLTEGQITGASVTVNMTLPGTIKTEPDAGAFNERGGLITFDTTGPRADSVRIPAISKTLMPGDSFSIADTDVAALITRLTTATTAANIQPRTTQDYQFVAARKGSKSLRK